MYVSKERKGKENVIVVVCTESEKVENHKGSNMRVTLKVLSGKIVIIIIIIICVDRDENECCVTALSVLQVKFRFVKRKL